MRSPVVVNRATLLEIRHLARRFGSQQAVADVSLSVQPGEVLGLLGPNGAGKSTTMMMISGLLKPDSGEILINGQPYDGRDPALKRTLGLVPQDLAIYPELNAIENLQFFGRLYGLSTRQLKERSDEVLERIGLVDSAHRPSGSYSGGMKRRLNFGISLMHEPAILILDEPTVGVDPQSRSHLLECVRDQARSGVGVIYASHYMEEVQSICERVAIVDHGRVLACDQIPRLLEGLNTELMIHVTGEGDICNRLAGLARIEQSPDGNSVLVVSGACGDIGERLRSILHHLMAARVRVIRIETQQTNLERLFLQLTGYALRD
ncbi:MAG: ABC transporter ATP-binding protein [Planctomycetes bacterium]|nr:ABC transporter ATP-binding protein [Planctomycetota bacterium]